MLFRFKPGVLLLLLFTSVNLIAQTSEQKALEEKREQLQSEIRDINRLLFAEKKEKGIVLQNDMQNRQVNLKLLIVVFLPRLVLNKRDFVVRL